jgi:hypothetical protein
MRGDEAEGYSVPKIARMNIVRHTGLSTRYHTISTPQRD